MTPFGPEFRAALAGIVGEAAVLGPAELAGRDPGFHAKNLGAALAALPRSTAEVAAVVRLARAHGIALVPQGGRTGLAGGAVTGPGELALMTARMARIEEIDAAERLAVVEAGATLAALQEAAAAHGLSAGIDLAARGTATIGGMIATNAGGMSAFRHGMMRHRLLGIEVVLPDGTVLGDMARVPKCNEGYDLKQLFCGAEGTLGIVTRAVLRLAPAEGTATTLLAACPDAAAALRLFRRLQDAPGLTLLHGEIMWRAYATRVAAAVGLGRVLSFAEAPVYAIYEVAAPGDDATGALAEALADAGDDLVDAVIAGSLRERDEIWRIREDSFAIDQTLPNGLWYDVSVPLGALDAWAASLSQALARIDPTLECPLFGHLGDGNLHITIGSGSPLPAEVSKAVSDAVYSGLKAMGGAISAEHGIGLEKRGYLAAHADPAKLRLMRAIKQALDPEGLMNPGKVL